METKISDHTMQCRLNKINEISDVLDDCNKIIDNLSERLHWDKKHLLSQVKHFDIIRHSQEGWAVGFGGDTLFM